MFCRHPLMSIVDTAKLLSSLRICIDSKLLSQGKLLHQQIVCLGLQSNVPLSKSLIDLYFSCHLHASARLVFDAVKHPVDVSLWNALIAAYTKNTFFVHALAVFQGLLRFPRLKPDCFTYPSVLKACGGLGQIGYGKMAHARVVKTGFVSDVVVASSVVGMYAKCRVFGYAVQVFDEMRERDVACWNTVISCYYQDGQCKKALQVFDEMRRFGYNPDSVTLTTVISSCARLLDLDRGRKIHRELMMTGFLLDGYIGSALVDMYGKCGCLDTARDVFEKIPRKSVVAWNSMIAGYGLRGQSDLCLELFRRMNKEGARPTSTTLSSLLTACSRSAELQNGKFVHGYIIRNRIEGDIYINGSLIDLYFKCGSARSAEIIFKNLSKINVIYWNLMISGYVILGQYFEALRLFDEMQEAGVRPDAITCASVLPACSQSGALEKGRDIHKCIILSKLETNEIVMGAVLDMYAKCGAVDEAVHVFDRLPERDIVSWTSMIMAYGSHGQALEALKLFHHMQHSGAKPDRITFLALMSACSHGGLVNEGQYYFDLMVTKYDIKPSIEHYSCLVDLLGRAGRLHDAYNIIRNTPDIHDDIGLLSTLFSACHLHREVELGAEIAGLLVEKDPDDPSTYIVLSNMYASAKKWDDVRKVRLKMKEHRLSKNPGCSWIEVDKRIQPFFSEDISRPQAGVYLECLAILNGHMEKDEESVSC